MASVGEAQSFGGFRVPGTLHDPADPAGAQVEHRRAAPPPNSGRLPTLAPDAEYHEIEGGHHNIGWTHADELNPLLAAFLAK